MTNETDAALVALLTALSLAELQTALADETLSSLMQMERAALLAHLKTTGVTVLTHRQKLATAIAKVKRNGGVLPSAEAAHAPPIEPVASAAPTAPRPTTAPEAPPTAPEAPSLPHVDAKKMHAAAGRPGDAAPHAAAALTELAGLKPPPARGKFVPEATGRGKVGEWTPVAPTITGKLRSVTPFDTHLKMKPRDEVTKEMAKLGPENPPIGHFHCLPFPYTFEMIVTMGAAWLTEALHTAGTLPRSNRVATLEAEAFVGGSMSLKAFLTVSYETQDEALHTRLFVKYPFPAATPHEQKGTYIGKFVMNNDGPEMDFMRLLSAAAPCRSPKYYFGDICLKTGLALLITERLEVPSHTSDFGPYEYEPIPYKSVDYLLDQPMAYYEAMTRNIAQLAAWGKIGKLGGGIEEVFQPPALGAVVTLVARV